jgi:hypothetical protein
MKMNESLGFITRVGQLAFGESARDGQQTIGDALHGGDHNDDAGILGSGVD